MGMKAQGTRLRVITENIANADTAPLKPGEEPYRRQIITFKNELEDIPGIGKSTAENLLKTFRSVKKVSEASLKELALHVGKAKAIVRARRSSAGEGMQVLVYTPDAPDLFARICGYFDQTGFSILDAKIHTAKNGYALDTFQVVSPDLNSENDHFRELAAMVESELDRTIETPGELPAPSMGRISRRVKSFPVAPRVDLRPDEKAQRWLLSVSASDRAGLLYLIARILAKHGINLQLAKVTTLGERVEDTFLISGPELQHNRAQIAIETELLQALNA